MENKNKITKEDAINFLIQCYFGHVDDPILSAIDRAYRDMQTHTLSGKSIELYKRRKKITEILYDAIQNIDKYQSFDKWHKETSDTIKDNYQNLSYGQIQKWINMSIKYLYTFKLLGDDRVSDYFNVENGEKFHPALDSYVLNEIGESTAWSKIADYDTYNSIRQKLSFTDEYLNWPQYAYKAGLKKNGETKFPEKGTYKRYVMYEGGYPFHNKQN